MKTTKTEATGESFHDETEENTNTISNEETCKLTVRVSVSVAEKWKRFIRTNHHSLRGPHSKEIENAMVQYMEYKNRLSATETPPAPVIKKQMLPTLRNLAMAFRDLPTFPFVKPRIVKSVIILRSGVKDRRSVGKYMKIVIDHSFEVEGSDSTLEWNVEEFCVFVDNILQDTYKNRSVL